MTEVLRKLKDDDATPAPAARSRPPALAELIGLIDAGHDQRHDREGRVREDVVERRARPAAIVEREGLAQVSRRGRAATRGRRSDRRGSPEQVASYRRRQDGGARLVRGPGDEEDRRAGQSPGRERAPPGGARRRRVSGQFKGAITMKMRRRRSWRWRRWRWRRAARAAAERQPRETATATVGGKKVSIDYGRPALKGRTFDELLKQLPEDRIWRAGENEVTTLTTEGRADGRRQEGAGRQVLAVRPRRRANGDWSLVLNSDPGIALIKICAKAPPARGERALAAPRRLRPRRRRQGGRARGDEARRPRRRRPTSFTISSRPRARAPTSRWPGATRADDRSIEAGQVARRRTAASAATARPRRARLASRARAGWRAHQRSSRGASHRRDRRERQPATGRPT